MSHRNKAIHDFSSQSTSSGVASGQPTQTQSKRGSKQTAKTQQTQQEASSEADSEFANDETEMLIGNCIRYILMKEYTRSVIKQIDISKHLCENHVLKRNAIVYIVKKAKKRLFDLFGLKMVELKENNCYILNNIYNLGEVCLYENEEIQANYANDGDDDIDIAETSVDDTNDGSLADDSDADLNGTQSVLRDLSVLNSLNHDEFIDICKKPLLLTILSLIFMNEDPLPEKEMFQLIKELGFNLEDKIETLHEGTQLSIKKLILEEFCRKGYLKRSKVANQNTSDETLYEFSWGQRAGLEFKSCDILEFVKDIYPMGDAALWNRYEKRAIEEDLKRQRQIFGADKRSNGNSQEEEVEVLDQEIDNGHRDSSSQLLVASSSGRSHARSAASSTANRKKKLPDLFDANNESDHELDAIEIDEDEVISQINQSLQIRRSSRVVSRSQIYSPTKNSNKISKAKAKKSAEKPKKSEKKPAAPLAKSKATRRR